MKKILCVPVVLAALSLAAPTYSENRHGVRLKGNDLSHYCDQNADAVATGICIGYISGIADSLVDVLCIPPDVEAGQLVKQTVKFMNENPAQLHHDAAPIVGAALQEGFPCSAR